MTAHITKRQMRIWNRRRLELLDAVRELNGGPELKFVADSLKGFIDGIDKSVKPDIHPFHQENMSCQN